MDSKTFGSISNFEKADDWYSEVFIRHSIVKFLKLNGYMIHKDMSAARGGKLIVASRYLKKELIEIKGFPASRYTNDINKAPTKNDNLTKQAKRWFSDGLFNSLINFANYYNDEGMTVALALPNVERYKIIINRVQEYFTLNNLYFKIYLVNQDGSVEISNLNGVYMQEILQEKTPSK